MGRAVMLIGLATAIFAGFLATADLGAAAWRCQDDSDCPRSRYCTNAGYCVPRSAVRKRAFTPSCRRYEQCMNECREDGGWYIECRVECRNACRR
jgi:hypothetical protein